MTPPAKKYAIGAELIMASQNKLTGVILFTFKLTFPRMILPEVNTHTIASKNTSSSRAIPVPKLMELVLSQPFVPHSFGTYKKGMQAGPPLTGRKLFWAIQVWKLGRFFDLAEAWIDHNVFHLAKEVTNHIYERFMWTEQIFSTTDVENLLKLRHHWMAEPHFQILAADIRKHVDDCRTFFRALNGSGDSVSVDTCLKCQVLEPGEWHLPYVGLWGSVKDTHDVETLKKVSAARCAWVSYFMPDDTAKKMDDFEPAFKTYARLAEGDPKHLSPLQHPATPLPENVRVGNYRSFLQFRKQITGESGGDEVVPSITPAQAKRLLREYELNKLWIKK